MTYKNKKMLNIIGHSVTCKSKPHRDATYTSLGDSDQKGKITSVENMEKLEPSHTTGRK